MLIAVAEPNCGDCLHMEVREDERQLIETWCALAREPLDDERIAATCPDFALDQFPQASGRKPGHSLPVHKEDANV